ncbi:MAG TPA: tetratricopeptide repeat protein [Paucimonas sp.]|nr:tetratricopeptide repeat protein [Paucimonas sp.]
MKHPAIALTALSFALASSAAFADEYAALLKAKKYAEVERAASARLGAEPNNAEALVAKTKAIVAQRQESRMDEAAKLAEQCIAAHPQKSECHGALGDALGNKAMMGGIMSAIGYAGKIREAYLKAVELDPNNIAARSSLQLYYLMAPGIVGGSKSKAQALAADTAKVNVQAGKLLQARIELDDEKLAQAENLTLSANPAGSDALQQLHLDVLSSVGNTYLHEKKYADAERVFQEVAKRHPESGIGAFGLARTLQEKGKPADAIPLYEKALAIEPRAAIYYRLGQCWQIASDKAKAMAAFEKALSFKPALPKQLKAEAEEQLKALKG